jgi:DNA-binding response OmpR family regulator
MDVVLVVEDSKSMQGVLRRLFESGGLEVRIASDGIAGLESFQKQRPTAVVLDLKLPDLPGKELCRAFKADAESVPVVVVSATTDVIDKVLLLELGADDYVTKPFSPKELLARVRRAIRRWGAKPPDFTNVAMKPIEHESLAFGDVHIDFTGMAATRAVSCSRFFRVRLTGSFRENAY